MIHDQRTSHPQPHPRKLLLSDLASDLCPICSRPLRSEDQETFLYRCEGPERHIFRPWTGFPDSPQPLDEMRWHPVAARDSR